MSSTRFSKMFTGVGLAATLAASLATPVSAAPLGADLGLAKSVPAADRAGALQWLLGCWRCCRRRAGRCGHRRCGPRPYYRDPYYYDAPPVVYAPAPQVYYAPAPRYAYGARCWVQSGPYRGQGYYTRC